MKPVTVNAVAAVVTYRSAALPKSSWRPSQRVE
jgi:hypothetical protein